MSEWKSGIGWVPQWVAVLSLITKRIFHYTPERLFDPTLDPYTATSLPSFFCSQQSHWPPSLFGWPASRRPKRRKRGTWELIESEKLSVVRTKVLLSDSLHCVVNAFNMATYRRTNKQRGMCLYACVCPHVWRTRIHPSVTKKREEDAAAAAERKARRQN